MSNQRETIIRHVKSNQGAPLSIYNVSMIAIEIAKLSDQERSKLNDSFQIAFNLMVDFQAKLSAIQSEIQDP